jgi:hypothetical protein
MKKNQTRYKAADLSDIEERITPIKSAGKYMSALIYGGSGTGKTTFACSFPGPVLVLDINDNGTDSVSDVKDGKVLHCEEWIDIETMYWYLKKNKKKFKTVVLDTVTMMQSLAMAQVVSERGGSKNGHMYTKQDWGQCGEMMKAWLLHYRDLQQHMNVVFLAQDRIHNRGDDESDEEGQIRPEMGARLSPGTASFLNAAVSTIGNTFIRERIIRIKTADKKEI